MLINMRELKTNWMASPSYALYGKISRRLRTWARRGRRQCWIYSGTQRQDGLPFKLAYSGSKQNKNYILRMIFSDGGSETNLGLRSREDFMRYAKEGNCDIAFTEDGQGPAGHDFKIPIWVPQKLDVTGDIEHQESLRSLRRRFRKNAIRCVFTLDEKDLKEFYTRFYVPFTSGNHQEEAFIHAFQEVLERAQKGELLLAYQGEECVGGNLLEYSKGEGRLSFIGVKPELVQEGIIGAITWASFLRIKEKNLSYANLGDSRGFLNDGSFRFKSGLGAVILPEDLNSAQYWSLHLFKKGAAVESFLAAHPFISPDGGPAQPHETYLPESRGILSLK